MADMMGMNFDPAYRCSFCGKIHDLITEPPHHLNGTVTLTIGKINFEADDLDLSLCDDCYELCNKGDDENH